jgi:Uma2 family endonuclease
MAVASGTHVGPWNEEDLLGLPGDSQRYEIVEGTLLVSPPPGGRHQVISLALAAKMSAVVPPGLVVVEAMGVRLPDDTVLIPDIVVAGCQAVLANQSGILDPAVVSVVVEIVSPRSQTTDRVTKPVLYARSAIPFLWRVEPDDGPAVVVYSLAGGRYVELRSAASGQQLDLDWPFPVSFDPGDLLP